MFKYYIPLTEKEDYFLKLDGDVWGLVYGTPDPSSKINKPDLPDWWEMIPLSEEERIAVKEAQHAYTWLENEKKKNMLVIHVRHNGNGFGAYYTHYASRIAAFSVDHEEFLKLLEKFTRRCLHFKIIPAVMYHPSYFCGLDAYEGNEKAQEILMLAKKCEGPWADWDVWANDADRQYEVRFMEFGYPIKTKVVYY